MTLQHGHCESSAIWVLATCPELLPDSVPAGSQTRASRVEQFADSLHSFKRRLKSHLFSLCFNN